jgi:hypothetical protein
MGYCYHRNYNGRYTLCCDICGESAATGHPARKYPCPFGYCQPLAACAKCRKEKAHLFGKPHHRLHGCEAAHIQFVATEENKRRIVDAGGFIRVAALNAGDKGVHVIFRGKTSEVAFYMPHEAYDAIPLLAPATPDDYRKYGALIPAPLDFNFKSL